MQHRNWFEFTQIFVVNMVGRKIKSSSSFKQEYLVFKFLWIGLCMFHFQQLFPTSPTGYSWLRHSSQPQRSVKLYCSHDHVTTPLCKQHCECTHQLSSSSSSGFFPFFLCLQWPILWCHQRDHHPQKRKKKNRKKEPNSPTSPTMKV